MRPCALPGEGYHSLGSSTFTLGVKRKSDSFWEKESEGEYEEDIEDRCEGRFEPGGGEWQNTKPGASGDWQVIMPVLEAVE